MAASPADEAFARLKEPGRVLVVDDESANRQLLWDLLETNGYVVEEAANGVDGLAAASLSKPDVILLDVMMPNLDGFAVCRRLKADPATAAVPVLIVTSLSTRQERLEGIRAGASDFVTKPIDSADLLLRVRNALRGKKLYDEMEAQYVRLRELELLRDSLVHMLVHDVRSPLGAFSAYLHLLSMDAARANAEEMLPMIIQLKTLARRMSDMVDTVLDVSRIESGRMPIEAREIEFQTLVEGALGALGPVAVERVQVAAPAAPLRVSVDREVIERVLINLIGNALKFSEDSVPVVVLLEEEAQGIRVAVRDTGPGIPADQLDIIFEKFRQARSLGRNHGTGLGLTFCRMAVEAHGGEIGVTSRVGQGTTFWFRLPSAVQRQLAQGVAS
ncbi:MAG TPA: hybrid sensor histidine kinase/response regulator [Gemmatimonadales bacterium]